MHDTSQEGARLYGSVNCTHPHLWEVAQSQDAFAIVPRKTSRGLIGFFVVLGAILAVVGTTVVSFMSDFHDKGMAIADLIAVALGLVGCGLFVLWRFRNEQKRGPILTVLLDKREVCLNRLAKSWPFESICRWRIVYGCRIQQSHEEKAHVSADFVSELHMVVQENDGKESVWAVIGALGRGDRLFDETARLLAEKTAVPIEKIDQ